MTIGSVKFISWEKKPRTMIRYLKQGDIFGLRQTKCTGW